MHKIKHINCHHRNTQKESVILWKESAFSLPSTWADFGRQQKDNNFQ